MDAKVRGRPTPKEIENERMRREYLLLQQEVAVESAAAENAELSGRDAELERLLLTNDVDDDAPAAAATAAVQPAQHYSFSDSMASPAVLKEKLRAMKEKNAELLSEHTGEQQRKRTSSGDDKDDDIIPDDELLDWRSKASKVARTSAVHHL
eukprot:TRINITY_DN4006_c0_g2_i1.p1 TRINITY_DN4006_c0_g2~~TRINITY_DN4006_c0_g2_i1.p1  ORF type:complete len:152 (-),score=56.37 TRINITY_DN4006_c0_g2_i1:55-510(-)